jgi:hypothetical protein
VITMAVKFSISFAISYFLLTIPVGKKQIFWHLYDITGPIGGKITKSVRKNIESSYNKTKNLGKQFFDNAQPRAALQPLNRKHKRIIEERRKRQSDRFIREEIHHKDTQALNNLIEKSR